MVNYKCYTILNILYFVLGIFCKQCNTNRSQTVIYYKVCYFSIYDYHIHLMFQICYQIKEDVKESINIKAKTLTYNLK